jgi:predicted GH43/DUF377 family glycosyl hydrolase
VSTVNNSNWQWGPFIKLDDMNPCLTPMTKTTFICPIRGEVKWEEKDVFNPAAILRDGKVHLLYRAEDKVGRFAGTSRIGFASSENGTRFERSDAPVLYPDHDEMVKYEWEGGCEDPRIVEDEHGTYYLTYTAYDGDKARLCVATSTDLVHWKKHGLAFAKAYNGKYTDLWSKSGSIVCKQEGERLVAEKINGSYWMYWGESNIYAAASTNLIDWTPVEKNGEGLDADSYLFPVISPRKHRFDSLLVEPGPPAIITDKGILLLYNSKNDPAEGDSEYAANSYSAAQVLLDLRDPACVIARSTSPFITPDKDYEINGQVNHVCFIEGLVNFQGRWLLYYGTADSKIAVAEWRP